MSPRSKIDAFPGRGTFSTGGGPRFCNKPIPRTGGRSRNPPDGDTPGPVITGEIAWVTDPSKFLVRVCATWPHLSSAFISRFYSKYRSSRAAADHVANTRTATGCNHVQLYSQKQCLYHPFSLAEYHSKISSPFHFFAYTITAHFIDVRSIIMSITIQEINKKRNCRIWIFLTVLDRAFHF